MRSSMFERGTTTRFLRQRRCSASGEEGSAMVAALAVFVLVAGLVVLLKRRDYRVTDGRVGQRNDR